MCEHVQNYKCSLIEYFHGDIVFKGAGSTDLCGLVFQILFVFTEKC